MVTLTPSLAVLAGAVVALWLVAGFWALIAGVRLQQRSRQEARQLDRLTQLLDGAPASPLIVRANGRIEAQPRLMSWLGLPRMPASVSDLGMGDAGLAADDLSQLLQNIEACRRTARSFTSTWVPRKILEYPAVAL